ncbi:hypothetical protein IQK56_28395 [Pseudomonas sp. MAFF 301449]|uniref:Uncharacterized protein n=1 Tax=Pseudomonas cyclaminis TaxID=2781239 RepID=A0ABR9T020_9PSED|nr:hypothetical protein [Pseudomonas cyclaminis]MBE8594505.1 hypothetical protein [Pseudomonas cyclaminis]MBE8603351.1 hypothetical protein [Pseudomonas cyclaminis]
MQLSTKFKTHKMQLAVLNEATTRNSRNLPEFTGEDYYGNPIVIMELQGCGLVYIPNPEERNNPIFNENMDAAIAKFDRETKKLYTVFPVSNAQC